MALFTGPKGSTGIKPYALNVANIISIPGITGFVEHQCLGGLKHCRVAWVIPATACTRSTTSSGPYTELLGENAQEGPLGLLIIMLRKYVNIHSEYYLMWQFCNLRKFSSNHIEKNKNMKFSYLKTFIFRLCF